MESTDVFAYLYPHNDFWERATRAIEASSRYVPARLAQPPSPRSNRSEQKSRKSPENQAASALDYLPCLELRFSQAPRTNRGLLFGRDPRCDIVLNYEGISRFHFTLTFDDDERLIVKDLRSGLGTQVTYDREGGGIRSDFHWIIGGHPVPQEKKCVIITVHDSISFQVVLPYHHIISPEYIDQVNTFCQGTTNDLDDLDNPGRSNAGALDTGDIELRTKLGQGAFGTVTHLWNVSTGGERVLKEPTEKAIRKQQVNHKIWRREARIMGQISHDHIVRLLQSSFTPNPELYLEFVPLGALDDHENISYRETLTILRQCLSALDYLHSSNPPIAHRDIKPANIFVHRRCRGEIFVKLGDFGLSRDSAELITICGTLKYVAPEMYSEPQRGVGTEESMSYTASVDLWSLGVVGGELACGLPPYEDYYKKNPLAWCHKIVEWLPGEVQERPNGVGSLLLNTMVILRPEARLSASQCYHLAMSLPSENVGMQRSTPAPHAGEEKHTQLHLDSGYGGSTVSREADEECQPENEDYEYPINEEYRYERRVPPGAELLLFSTMWSEHGIIYRRV